MRIVVVEPATEPVISWEEAAAHLRLGDDDSEQDLVTALVQAVTDHLAGPDGWLGRSLAPQTLELWRLGWGHDAIRLPLGPVTSIVEIGYIDGLGDAQIVDPGDYERRDDLVDTAFGKRWPALAAYRGRAERVRIRYRAGYEPVPEAIKAAMKLMIGDLFEQRASFVTGTSTAEVAMSVTAERLLAPYRLWC